jgi:Ca2+-binding RTX toxin-like protein
MTLYSKSSVSVEALRSEADTISSYATMVFSDTETGTFYYKIDKPLEGQQIAALSDVSHVDFGDDSSIIQNVAQLASISVFQVRQVKYDGEPLRLDLVNIERNVTTKTDEVLGQKFPSATNNSIYVSGEIGAGYGTEDNDENTTYLDEFYISVSGDRGVFDQVYGSYGLDAPNDGRVLLTVDNITGARDLNWGSWLDTIHYDANPATEMEIAADDAVGAERDEVRQALNDKNLELESLKSQLDLAREHLANLQDIDKLQTAVLVLNGFKAAGDVASLVLAYTGVGAARAGLLTARDAISELASSNKLAGELEKIYENPSLENINSTYSAFVTVLTKSVNYKGYLAKYFSAAKAAKSTYELYESGSQWNKDNQTINSAIKDATKTIDDLQNRINSLKTEGTPTKLNFTSTKNVLSITGDAGSIKLMLGEGYILSSSTNAKLAATAGFTNYILGDDKQTLKLSSGSFIVDGVEAQADKLVIADNIGNNKIEFGLDNWVNLTSSKTSALVHGVSSIVFNDGVIGDDQNNVITSGKSYKTIFAAGGNDKVTGGTGGDKLYGQHGNDTVAGGDGADTLNGGFGRDVLTGGQGADTFIFQNAGETHAEKNKCDVIRDFAKGDRIDLRGIDANAELGGNQAFTYIGSRPFSGNEGELSFQKVGKNIYVYGDTNGDKLADFAIRVDLLSSIKSSDFFL